jgi:hypothetical protein
MVLVTGVGNKNVSTGQATAEVPVVWFSSQRMHLGAAAAFSPSFWTSAGQHSAPLWDVALRGEHAQIGEHHVAVVRGADANIIEGRRPRTQLWVPHPSVVGIVLEHLLLGLSWLSVKMEKGRSPLV